MNQRKKSAAVARFFIGVGLLPTARTGVDTILTCPIGVACPWRLAFTLLMICCDLGDGGVLFRELVGVTG